MPSSSLIAALQNNSDKFLPVVDFDPATEKLYPMDLGIDNNELTADIFNDTGLYTSWVNEKLAHASARYAIGGYCEIREVYSFSHVFDGAGAEDEPRRFHLGIDIWGKPHTKVMAPLDGLVHSFANNDSKGDYGATIILSHHLDHCSFYTLYGHLSLNSIKNLEEGQHIHAGEVFAEFGIPSENGQWPPHLHFQVIRDINGWKGDYPGVCKISEKEEWLANCPDPDLILNLNQYIVQ